jgi:hypothetical protein
MTDTSTKHSMPHPKRPFLAHAIRVLAVPIILLWVFIVVVVNTIAPTLEAVGEGLTDIHRLGTALLDDDDPMGALRRWLVAYVAQGSMFDGLARTLARPRADDEWSTCQLARSAGSALVARAAAAGLIRDDIDIADVLDIAAAVAWVGEQPERDAGQRDRLLRVIIDGLRPANAAV